MIVGIAPRPQRVKTGSRGSNRSQPEHAMVARELMGGAADVIAGIAENEFLEMNELARDWRIDRGNAAVGSCGRSEYQRIPKARPA